MERIGTYEVEGLLGDGGMGAVYKGMDPRFGRPVAIKVLHPQFQRDAGVVERFKAEAVIQAKLNHPNIVTVYDFVADGSTLAMVMEYVDGRDLGELIEANGGPMGVERALALMGQALSAMALAHAQGLVHRDIKPSNMIVQELGGEEILKVMDFGIAKILGSEKMRTATGAKMGTLAYMSPEQVRSPKNVDARSDVYSLGLVLYEMLTGKVPFEADSEYELMEKILTAEPRSTTDFNRALPQQLVSVLAVATAKDPARRFATAEQFRNALRALGGGQGAGVAGASAWPAARASSPPPIPQPRGSVFPLPPGGSGDARRAVESAVASEACASCGSDFGSGVRKILYGHSVCESCWSGYLHRRQIAWVADVVALYVLAGAAGLFFSAMNRDLGVLMAYASSIGFLLLKDSFLNGRSPGKAMAGLQVIDRTSGAPGDVAASAKRNLPNFVPLAFLIMAFQIKEGFRWGDGWANTKVIWSQFGRSPVFGPER